MRRKHHDLQVWQLGIEQEILELTNHLFAKLSALIDVTKKKASK